MNEHLQKTVYQVFNNAIYSMHGAVCVALHTNPENTCMRLLAFNVPSSQIHSMSPEEQEACKLADLMYDNRDVDFNDKYAVLQRIHDLTTDIEVKLYNAKEGEIVEWKSPTLA